MIPLVFLSLQICETSGTQIVDLIILRHPVAMKEIYDTVVLY